MKVLILVGTHRENDEKLFSFMHNKVLYQVPTTLGGNLRAFWSPY